MDRHILPKWVVDALKEFGGLATIVEVSKHIWAHHHKELEASGDFFYKWQYEVRWAVANLRKNGRMKSGEESRRGVWELV